MPPTIYADFHNADAHGRLRLNCAGTARDLAAAGVRLADGLRLCLTNDEMETVGEVRFSEDERVWVAVIDSASVRAR